MELEVLVVTMGQSDCSLAEKMNIPCNAVIANQCGRWDYTQTQDGRVRMLSSDTIGVGINRNFTLQLAKADILLFADDDITYYDGSMQMVVDAFRQFPKADVIFFGIDMTREGKVFDKRRNKPGRLHLWNALRFGAARMAIRREAVQKHRLSFTTLFGGGCQYGSGEDTILIRECFRAGLRVYAHDGILGACAKDSSTWFSGYNDKYFYDWGAIIACAFPRIKHLMKWYFVFKFHKKTKTSVGTIRKQINRGIRGFRSLTPWKEER